MFLRTNIVANANSEFIRKRYTENEKMWIRQRDGKPHSPVLDGKGKLIDLDIEDSGQVHHIHMIYHFLNSQPNTDPNSPINGFYVGNEFHQSIHRDWIEPLKEEYLYYSKYMSFEDYVKQETWNGKRAYWLMAYDDILNSMAIINSYQFLASGEKCPFSDYYQRVVKESFHFVECEVFYQYRDLKQFYGIS